MYDTTISFFSNDWLADGGSRLQTASLSDPSSECAGTIQGMAVEGQHDSQAASAVPEGG